MNNLSNRLRELRMKNGWTKVEVSKRLGMKASSTYSNWEYGNREPSIDRLLQIAELFEVSINYLVCEYNETLKLEMFMNIHQEIKCGNKNLNIEEKKILKNILISLFYSPEKGSVPFE